MLNNDVLRSVRYLLDLSEPRVAEIMGLAGLTVERSSVAAWLKREDEPGFAICDDRTLAHFLDGLVIDRRGRIENQSPRPTESHLDNNLILKKLRVAFELKETDLQALLQSTQFAVSKQELNALFRKRGHPNYRPCGDQLLRNLLKGLTLRYRG